MVSRDDQHFTMIADERRTTAALLAGLTESQWDAQSLCDGWRIREVAVHLTMPFSLSVPRMLVKLATTRFDYDRVADRWAREDTRSNAELIETLRANAESRFTPPGLGPPAPLTDIVVHGQDICRPLDLARSVADDRSAVVLDFLVSRKARRGFVPNRLVDGIRFQSADSGWTHGEGVEVVGTAVDLILAISGRRHALDQLTGDGVSTLRERHGL